MTIGSIAIICVVAGLGLPLSIFFFMYAKEEKSAVATVCGVICVLLSVAICIAIAWWQLNSESGKRALKTQQSNLHGGITRVVKVYDMEGDEIARYEGKFDVAHRNQDNRIMFDDENGKRHIVYYTTGTITVDEK